MARMCARLPFCGSHEGSSYPDDNVLFSGLPFGISHTQHSSLSHQQRNLAFHIIMCDTPGKDAPVGISVGASTGHLQQTAAEIGGARPGLHRSVQMAG
jgi:hypothetical protein